jgi:hypothetical protein
LFVAFLFALITRDLFRFLVLPKFHHLDSPAYIEGHLLQTWQVFALTFGFAIVVVGLAFLGFSLFFRHRRVAA